MNFEVDRKQINSRIQMPKFLLKRFCNENHELYGTIVAPSNEVFESIQMS